MARIRIYGSKDIRKQLHLRPGEVKVGEQIGLIQNTGELGNSPEKFVLVGIPEDIGVRANHGKPGASTAWHAFLDSFLNLQANRFLSPKDVLLLGKVDCTFENEKADQIDDSDPNYHLKLGELVDKIDEAVKEIIGLIVSAGKIPLVIGGGHNNALGILRGASMALDKPLNALNIDAHSDLRSTEHRHSGNGFSYAIQEACLKRYGIFGLQENYTPQYIFDYADSSRDIEYVLFDRLPVSGKMESFKKLLSFSATGEFGLELDCDSIAEFPCSAFSPSGFTLEEVRSFIKTAARKKECTYFHICEAWSTGDFPTGKALSFLVSDFIKSRSYE